MNKFSGKRPLSHLAMLGLISLSLSACTKTLDWLFDAPEAHQAEMAPLESRASVTNRDAGTAQPAGTPTAPPATSAQATQAEVRSLLNAWRDAWAKRDVPTYLSFYHPAFKGNESSPENWRASRQRIINHAKKIELSIGEPEIRIDAADHATASFTQKYRANSKNDAGRKTLQLRRIDGRWLIEQEVFSASGK